MWPNPQFLASTSINIGNEADADMTVQETNHLSILLEPENSIPSFNLKIVHIINRLFPIYCNRFIRIRF